MRCLVLGLVMSLGVTVIAQNKKTQPIVTKEAGNETVDIYATPYLDKEHITKVLGAELPPGIVVFEVRVRPKGDYVVSVSRDDFQMLSHRDGQRSGPFVPSQIAGSATLVVSNSGRGGGLYSGNPNGPVWGGVPGTMGRPRQIGSPNSGAVGAGGGSETETTASVQKDASKEGNPLLTILEEKMLPEKESNDPVAGLLYFPLDGKHKLKDLELVYKGPAGKLMIDFGK
jgi:hypothetical protein